MSLQAFRNMTVHLHNARHAKSKSYWIFMCKLTFLASYYCGWVFLQVLEPCNRNKQSLKKHRIFLTFKLFLDFPVRRAHGPAISWLVGRWKYIINCWGGGGGVERKRKRGRRKREVIIIDFFISQVINKQNGSSLPSEAKCLLSRSWLACMFLINYVFGLEESYPKCQLFPFALADF